MKIASRGPLAVAQAKRALQAGADVDLATACELERQSFAVLFGNEHDGPSPETLAACAGTFRIPMAGFTQSFNVSVAAGIALAHVTGRRRAHLNAAGDLSQTERVELQQRFTLLAAKLARRLKSSG